VAEYDLYIDIDRQKVVISQTNADDKELPKFALGDTFGLRIHLVKNYTRASNYEVIPTTGITIQAALGNLSTGTIYCSQYSWAEEDGTSWYATFPMNTEELTTALTSQTSISATFEIKYVESGLPTTVFQESVTVYKALINPTSVMPAAQRLSRRTTNHNLWKQIHTVGRAANSPATGLMDLTSAYVLT
jgi:hypothetical protein